MPNNGSEVSNLTCIVHKTNADTASTPEMQTEELPTNQDVNLWEWSIRIDNVFELFFKLDVKKDARPNQLHKTCAAGLAEPTAHNFLQLAGIRSVPINVENLIH